jgi:hypothetical protein
MKNLSNTKIFAIALLLLSQVNFICAIKIPTDAETVNKRNNIDDWVFNDCPKRIPAGYNCPKSKPHETNFRGSFTRPLSPASPPVDTINIIRQATDLEQKGQCHNYAFAHIAEDPNIAAYDVGHLFYCAPCYIESFFTPTDNPKKGDLIVYSDSKNNNENKHYAIANDEQSAHSKFEWLTPILQHGFNDIPTHWGDVITFYTLKDNTPEGKKALKNALAFHAILPSPLCYPNSFTNKVIAAIKWFEDNQSRVWM